jgi:hypothetical protein
MVVATSSSRLPNPAWNLASERMPPAPATTATARPAASEARASIRFPLRNETCSMAQQAAEKASTATVV